METHGEHRGLARLQTHELENHLIILKFQANLTKRVIY